MSAKQKQHHRHDRQVKHHTESSKSHDARAQHDRHAKAHNDDVYANQGRSNATRYAVMGITAAIVITLPVLFIGGFIKW